MNDCEEAMLSESDKERLIAILTEELPVLRAKVGLSQEEVANIIGLSRQTYHSIETKKRKLSWRTYLAFLLFYSYNKQTANLIGAMNAFPDSLRRVLSFDGRNPGESSRKNGENDEV